MGRYQVAPIDTPATGFSLPLLGSGERIWVLGPEGIAAALVMELRRRKVNAQATANPPDTAQACIHLGALAQPASREAAMAMNREAFALARRLAPNLANKPGLFVTVQDTGGAFGFENGPEHSEWLAGLPALLKTCALEWPQASLKAIDIAQAGRSEAEIAKAIADELLGGGGEIEVGLAADGRRRSLRCVARQAHPDAAAIEAGDVVVVSGGARGVTAACLIEWAREAKPCFVLLGRSRLQDEPAQYAGITDEAGLKQAVLAATRADGQQPTPAELQAKVSQVLAGREIRSTLAALREAGAQAHYLCAPVDNAVALRVALDEVRSAHGPIRGLIHAAGVLADKRIAEKTDAMFDRVFDTKVRGLAAMLDATANDPLKLLAVFSSVSARCGNTGQADYAMANEVLARVMRAQARTRPGLRVKSLGWGPWEGGMVSPALKARFAELGVPMIPLEEGARLFAQEMDDAGAVELVLGGEPRPEALLSDGAEGRVEALELVVRRDSHGYLEGHALNGEPVVPVVLAAEWLTRAARSLRPGRHVQALLDLKVLKGIRLHGFENGGDRLRIEARPVPGSQGRELSLSIRSPGGTPHYSARVVLGDAPLAPGAPVEAPSLQPWSGGPLYGELLFHRQSFELIDSLDGISDEGVAATVRGVQAANWPAEDWQLDVAALDAGLQTAVLYGRRMLGSANLPTAIGELRSFGAPTSGTIRVSAQRRQVGASATTTDIVLSDSEGRRVAELIGVTNHAF
jgi:NAD(P)-dependent dehydrogenase (short-subunit alcohol dehydrogenase family)